jgi:hypothetical protein
MAGAAATQKTLTPMAAARERTLVTRFLSLMRCAPPVCSEYHSLFQAHGARNTPRSGFHKFSRWSKTSPRWCRCQKTYQTHSSGATIISMAAPVHVLATGTEEEDPAASI